MSIPAHVVPRQSRQNTAEHDRATLARQLLLGRYLDPWGTPDIAWCHSHTLVRGYKVLLNVYDLLPRRLNGGAFHSGVQVGATEYAFGGHPNDDLGITVLKKPLFVLRAEAEAAVQNDEDRDGSAAATLDWMPTLRSRVVVGWWMGPLTQLDVLLRELRFDELWVGSEYRLLSRNCNHFARAMLSGMLRNPLFKAAPGCSRPEDMLPRSVTRLPALVLALGSCAPCLVRRLNAPLPLAPHSLNTFQGQGRRARLEGQPARLAPADSQAPGGNGGGGDGGRGGGGTASQVSVTMTAGSATTAVAVLAGVRPSSSSVMSSLGVGGDGGRGGVVVTAAAAAAEGRTMRLTARFQSLRLETTPRASMEGPARNSFRRDSEDGSGGVAGGGDGTEATGDDASTTCSSSDLAAATAGGTAAFSSHNPVGDGQTVGRCTGSHLLPPECTSAGSGNLTETTPDVSAVVPPFAAVYARRTGCSLSLHPPSLIMEPSYLSASSSSSVAAAAATTSVTSPGSNRASNMHRFLSTSRSGRRVFPDPRAILGQEQENFGGGDAAAATTAHENNAALIPDGGGTGNACHLIQHGVGSPVQDELEMTSSTSQLHDADASRVFRPSATVSGSGASPWPSPLPLSKSQQVHCKPRYSGGDLPSLGIMPLLGHDRPLPQSQLLLQMPQHSVHYPPSTLLLRGTAVTADGAAAAATSAVSSAGGTGARHHSPTDTPHPWSILSGGFVNLLFSPSASTEPQPGVPHRVAISSMATSAGGRRISSLTGDGASIFSTSSHIAVGVGGGGGGGCLATVNSGDLSDDGDDGGDDVVKGAEDLQKAVVRTRASTGTLGISLGGRGGGSSCSGSPVTVIGMVTPTPTSDLAAAAAPGSNLIWPAGPVRRVGTRVIGANGLGAHPFLFPAAAAPTAAAAVAVVADEAPAAALAGRKAH